MTGLKKDHRGLRRRPLYTPLAIVVISLLVAALVGAWLVASWGTTSVVLVRHAERAGEGLDANLTAPGYARAMRLAETLSDAGVDAIYVTEARRTQDTAAPLAERAGVVPRVIPAAEHDRLLRRLKWRHRGDIVLVVGHGNTVPLIAEGLGAPIHIIEADEFSGLWVITYSRLRGTRLLALRY
ncbi:MAG: phosphoglycerate mutase family protein [Gammaproteobacteria bacterium]